MKNKPKISIITICYNAEQFIEKAIKSVIDQDYFSLEYIIIDGGSTDGTVDIIKKYASKIDYWISEKDNGISHAFNKGIAKATGEVIGLLNADDYYLPDVFKTIANNIDNGDILYGKMRTVVGGENKGDYLPDHHKLEEDMTLCHPSTFIKKVVYNKIGDYNEDYKLAMDYELLIRCYKNHESFYFIDDTLTVMNMEGISNELWLDAFKEVIKAQNQHLPASAKRKIQQRMKLTRKSVASALMDSPLSFAVDAYRRRFSKIKKESHE